MSIVIPLSKTVEVTPGNFTSQVELKYIYTYTDRLELHTSIGVLAIYYPECEEDFAKFTVEELGVPAGEFIKQVIPAKVKAWAEK